MRPLRAVLHAHSDWSYDGRWPLSRLARLYGALGIDAVMMSEHDSGFDPARFGAYRAACAAASTGRCTLIPGIEYSSPENDIHLPSWGLDAFLAEHRPVAETLRAVHDRGGAVILAHPLRRAAWQHFEAGWTPFLSGIELWNRKSDGITWSRRAWELIRRTGLPATVGQDFHRPRHFYPLTMTFPRRAGWTLERTLVAGLREGAGTPCLFGRPLHEPGTPPQAGLHDRLDRLRRGLQGR